MRTTPLLVAVAILLVLPGATAASPQTPADETTDDTLPDERPDALTDSPWSDEDDDAPQRSSHDCKDRTTSRSDDCRHRHERASNRSDEDQREITCDANESCEEDRRGERSNETKDRNRHNESSQADEEDRDRCPETASCSGDEDEAPDRCPACSVSHPPYDPDRPSIPEQPDDGGTMDGPTTSSSQPGTDPIDPFLAVHSG